MNSCPDRIIWFGRYEGWLRWLCHGVKDGDIECMDKAARLFDVMLPRDSVIVPMPSHDGKADRILSVAQTLRGMDASRSVCDVLMCRPHVSNYVQKKIGGIPQPIKMMLRCRGALSMLRTTGKPVFIIDNCIGSGVTAMSALAAIPFARVCVLAKS